MTATETAAAAPKPRWDGRRVLFEMQHGGAEVACAISPDALRDLASERCHRPADLLRCFAAERARIEVVVAGKLRARGMCGPGPVTIWSDDVEDFAQAAAGPAPGEPA